MELEDLNAQQAQAVKHKDGPILVVAGAGTGKTQVITSRIAYLIKHYKVTPTQILAVTFTEKAAQEMEVRVSELLKEYILDVNITTFNAFGYEVIRRFAYELGMNPSLQLLSETQKLVFLRDHLDELNLRYYSPITKPEGMLADLAVYFSKLQSELVDFNQYTKFAQNLKKQAQNPADILEAQRHLELAAAYKNYQNLKQLHNVIDFDDQVGLTIKLLEKFANVRQKLQAEFKYLLVDEFQDTNVAQSRLIDLLVEGRANVMVVGDDDQSIYRFRGAAIANILGFLERYPQAERITLTQNYRSSQSILDAAHRLIQHNNPDRLESKYQIDKRLRAQFKGREPVLKTFLTWDEEAAFIAQDIKARLQSGKIGPSQVAVLIRKHTQAGIVARYLEASNIDYHIVGQTDDLYKQREIKILLNFLHIVTDPQHTESLYHLLVSDVYQFDPVWLRAYVSTAVHRHLPLESVLSQAAEAESTPEIAKLQTFLHQLHEFRTILPQLSVGQLCFKFIKDSGYLHRLVQAAKNEPTIDSKIANLNQFFSTLREFEAVATDSSATGYIKALPSLLGSGERLVVEDLPELFGQKVLVMTIHKAKGLEFETVYLFDLSQDTFPSRERQTSLGLPPELMTDNLASAASPQILEERRLMYVAITRAKRELIITYSPDHGGRRAKRPSIFIEEALGKQPSLNKLKASSAPTDQIELFKLKPSISTTKNLLPPHLLRDNTVFLTQKQIDDYLMCPAEFYLRYVLSPPQPPSFALEYGNLMHNLIQFYNRRALDGQSLELEKLLEYLEANWPQDNFVSPGHHKRSIAQAKKTITKFWQRERSAPRHPDFIEQSFEFELKEAKSRIRGRFDAVYGGKVGQTEIRDYKTGAVGVNSQEKANQKAKSSFQLGLYALAWQRINGEAPAILSLDFIDSGLVGSASKSPRQLQTVENKICMVADGVRAQNFTPASSHLFCTHPEYGF